MSSEDTRERLLDAAEELFSERDFSAVSIREISSRASVGSAALNYHFGSKHDLIGQMLRRRIRSVNRERLRLLDKIESRSNKRPPTLCEVLEAFLAPVLSPDSYSVSGKRSFMKLLGRIYLESDESFDRRIVEELTEVFRRFNRALQRTLPDVPNEELLWRVHFLVGAMAYTMAHTLDFSAFKMLEGGGESLSRPKRSMVKKNEDEAKLIRLIQFAQAGLEADVSGLDTDH
jgi:AcrR family transcriptional regulator